MLFFPRQTFAGAKIYVFPCSIATYSLDKLVKIIQLRLRKGFLKKECPLPNFFGPFFINCIFAIWYNIYKSISLKSPGFELCSVVYVVKEAPFVKPTVVFVDSGLRFWIQYFWCLKKVEQLTWIEGKGWEAIWTMSIRKFEQCS